MTRWLGMVVCQICNFNSIKVRLRRGAASDTKGLYYHFNSIKVRLRLANLIFCLGRILISIP